MPKAKPSGIGRVLNGGQPLACGHCRGETAGAEGELKGIDVSSQGVSCEIMNGSACAPKGRDTHPQNC